MYELGSKGTKVQNGVEFKKGFAKLRVSLMMSGTMAEKDRCRRVGF